MWTHVEFHRVFRYIVEFAVSSRLGKILSECWFTNRIHQFHFRIVNEFNDVYKYVTFAVFSWTFLTICINLLLFVVQLVEYKIKSIANIIFRKKNLIPNSVSVSFFLSFCRKVGRKLQFNWVDFNIGIHDLVVRYNLLFLWIWYRPKIIQ